jgi:hypothetical protein
MLREYLGALQAADASGSVLVVAGDPAQPQGPYPDTASVIDSGLLERYGVRQVSVVGHPAGLPAADHKALWSALAGKAAALEQRGLGGSVVTQFGFDPGLVLAWLADARARGVGKNAVTRGHLAPEVRVYADFDGVHRSSREVHLGPRFHLGRDCPVWVAGQGDRLEDGRLWNALRLILVT